MPLRGRRGLLQPSSCSAALSLTSSIGQERLNCAALTSNPTISAAYSREVYFLLMLPPHCGSAEEFCSLWTWAEGFLLMHVSLLSWLRG